jgi:FkbM family methyltransferase
MLRLVRRDWVVVDVGANIGWYTLMAAKAMRGTGAVHAFEPASEEFSRFERNLTLNKFANVTAHQQAMSDSAGEAYLTELRDYGMTRLATSHDDLRRPVTVTTLDVFAETEGLTRLDFVKVDIEGAEMLFLRGGRSSLARFHPILMMELHERNLGAFGCSPAQLLRQLTECGYRVFRVTRKGLDALMTTPSGSDFTNVVAVPVESLAGVAQRLSWAQVDTIAARRSSMVR